MVAMPLLQSKRKLKLNHLPGRLKSRQQEVPGVVDNINMQMLPPLFTWLPLTQLPKVPQHFINQCYNLKSCKSKLGMWPDGRTEYTDYYLGEEWHEWVKQNIISTFSETAVRIVPPTNESGAHTDNPSKLRLFYLIERGGDKAETIWYYKPGGPMMVDNRSWVSTDKSSQWSGYYHNNLEELIVLDRVKYPLNTWVLINPYILHGIENVESERIFFVVNVHPEQISYNISSVN